MHQTSSHADITLILEYRPACTHNLDTRSFNYSSNNKANVDLNASKHVGGAATPLPALKFSKE